MDGRGKVPLIASSETVFSGLYGLGVDFIQGGSGGLFVKHVSRAITGSHGIGAAELEGCSGAHVMTGAVRILLQTRHCPNTAPLRRWVRPCPYSRAWRPRLKGLRRLSAEDNPKGLPADAADKIRKMLAFIHVPNIPEAVTYYTQKMGYREAFRVNDDKGQPRLVYMQISKSTFLELNQASAQRPAGFTHYGLHVDSAAAAVAKFRVNGVMVSDTNTSDTKAILANVTDPYMGRIELAELTPESLHYKAIQSWK
jgi:hypothetical protein